jgi:sterol desaturase/sphingolipid hydroxylase (fatty acid hydroxylase superfamily)
MKAWLEGMLGPVLYDWASTIYWTLVAPIISEQRHAWYVILSTVLAALGFYVATTRGARSARGFLAFLLPRSVFLHPSALLDYKYFALNQLVMLHLRLGTLVAGVVGLLALADSISRGLGLLLGPRSVVEPGFFALLAFTVVNLLAADFGKYVAHYVAHKVPLLWEFHKPHHAAEVLTPLSANRAHPVDIMLDLFFRLLCTGVVGGVYGYLYPSGITELQILGFNAVALIVNVWISHLQHSHIPLGYGPWLSKILVSPFMHQVHHSQEKHHWDRNFGFLCGLWDWMFGTIYVPRHGEQFRLGLPDGKGAGQYRTLREMYLRPFWGAWRLLSGQAGRAEPA